MFLNTVGEPTKIKKIVYLILSVILGVFLSFIVHAIIEINYLSFAETKKIYVIFYGGCALPYFVQAIILLIGIFGGYFMGKFWWRKIYIERFWEKKK